ncbi:MAG TPA: hypothetical protein VGV15_11560, partial [Terriglobales bacterium]|nr:hypothetical protein [Terriglobales bacterium]
MVCNSLRCRLVYLVVALVLLIACSLPSVDAQSSPNHPQQQKPLPDAPSAVIQQQKAQAFPARTGTAQHVDAPWPREAVRGDERVSMYQPQLETWKDD